jgi:hypothetical protein
VELKYLKQPKFVDGAEVLETGRITAETYHFEPSPSACAGRIMALVGCGKEDDNEQSEDAAGDDAQDDPAGSLAGPDGKSPDEGKELRIGDHTEYESMKCKSKVVEADCWLGRNWIPPSVLVSNS